MKYYAADGVISQQPLEGGIEISREQYQEALAGIAHGHIVTIDDGFAVGPKQEPEKEPDPETEPEPHYKTQFSVLEFRDRFTIEEQLAIRQAQFDDMEVGLVYDSFQAAQFIDIEDPRVEQGIDLYISKGLLAPGRKGALLEPETVEPEHT